MNCSYCQKKCLQNPNKGYDLCENCYQDWSVRYSWEGFAANPTINWLAIYNQEFYVELDFRDQQTRFFNWIPKDNQYILITYFNQLEKVTPANIQRWLDRILNLKVFY